MTAPSTSASKVTLYHYETGQCVERWPVDAQEMLKRGWTRTPPEGVEVAEADPLAVDPLNVPPPASATTFPDAATLPGALTGNVGGTTPSGAPLAIAREGETKPLNLTGKAANNPSTNTDRK